MKARASVLPLRQARSKGSLAMKPKAEKEFKVATPTINIQLSCLNKSFKNPKLFQVRGHSAIEDAGVWSVTTAVATSIDFSATLWLLKP